MQIAGLLSAVGAFDLLPSPSASAATTAGSKAAMNTGPSASDIMTLEAFADTMIPGEKRYPTDYAIAGAASGPGGVQGGAIALLERPDMDVINEMPTWAAGLNQYAAGYAEQAGIKLNPALPPFVALSFPERTAVAVSLTTPGPENPQQSAWATLALVIALAFDGAMYEDTTKAVAQDHPGLIQTLRFPLPDPDGLWRNPQFSYGRALAPLYPGTTSSGSPE
jgi:enediyne biosynthesis protein E8